MEKLTELHHGVPVIKDKRFDLAAKKLYEYESKLEQGYVLFPLKEFLERMGKLPVPVVREKFEPTIYEPIELEPHMPKVFDTNLLLKYSGWAMMQDFLMDGIVIAKAGEKNG